MTASRRSAPEGRPFVVVGDALLDVDLAGTADRLAPDAPVPVVGGIAEHVRPGGAALAATLLALDGHDVVLVTALGDDAASRDLCEALPASVSVVPLPLDGELGRKVRVRASGQSVARLDYGRPGPVGEPDGDVAAAFDEAGAVLVSDYGRGVTSVAGLRSLIACAARGTAGRPGAAVVWDPHPRGADPVAGTRIATPNAAEAHDLAARARGTRRPVGPPAGQLAEVAADARLLADAWQVAAVCVTMGPRGALVTTGGDGVPDNPLVVPAPPVPCPDSCGAGDRFASSVTAALAGGLLLSEAVGHAVEAASWFVASGGAAALGDVNPHAHAPSREPGRDAYALADTVRASGGTVVATGGCFDLLHAGHVATLRAARALGDCLVVCLNSDASIRRLKGNGRPLVGQGDRRQVLEALECVDAVVVFDDDTPASVLRRLRPHVWAKGGDYGGAILPEAQVLAGWGGQAVVLPYLDGRSTSRLLRAATAEHHETPAQHGGAASA